MGKTIDKNSMLYWWPKIETLPIPQPRTIAVNVSRRLVEGVADGIMYSLPATLADAARQLGYPVFIRSDYLAGKHHWKDTCYVATEDDLASHVYRVIEETLTCDMLGKPVKAIIFREFIPMESRFTAFYGNMPVNPERRYFVRDGKVICHHPYWIEDALARSKRPSVPNWRELARVMNHESPNEIEQLSAYAEMVSQRFDGYWSVDFCKAKDGRWLLIDMAMGDESWHPAECLVLLEVANA